MSWRLAKLYREEVFYELKASQALKRGCLLWVEGYPAAKLYREEVFSELKVSQALQKGSLFLKINQAL